MISGIVIVDRRSLLIADRNAAVATVVVPMTGLTGTVTCERERRREEWKDSCRLLKLWDKVKKMACEWHMKDDAYACACYVYSVAPHSVAPHF
jgi:hypothetical protein